MSRTQDELAGVVDLFGALTGDELEQALVELAFKQGREVDRDAFVAEIDAAVTDYYLVEADHEGETLLLAGPAAFPALPENAADLPHILDVDERSLDRAAVGESVAEQLREDAERAVADADESRAATLFDVSYDLEAWAPVGAGDVRERLDGLVA